ncbi:MAG: hypothetical protein KY393_02080 [Actinobacteria bacterium]|nr:hypothetical protein [Actinomycetota bacterium]
MSLLSRLAASTTVPVFAVTGGGGCPLVSSLRTDPRARLVASPRHAAVLVIAGTLPPRLVGPVQSIHDQMPHPRFTALAGTQEDPTNWGKAVVADSSDPIQSVVDGFRALVAGRHASEPDWLPDSPPAEWRGVGPFGQGGEGMMGGKPFGRPMAEMAPDRDGLMLDALNVGVGPFHPALPPGLELRLELHGDVVADVGLQPNPYLELGKPAEKSYALFEQAQREAVPIARVETLRAAHLLGTIASAVEVAGLESLGRRLRTRAADPSGGDQRGLSRLRRALIAGVRWSARGVVRLPAEELQGSGLGPTARASGVEEDARLDDAGYLRLGFAPITRSSGDCLDRLLQMLDEAEQALELASKAGTGSTSGNVVEGVHGVPGSGSSPALLSLIEEHVPGLEWSDAVSFIASLGVDLQDIALAERRVVE